MSISPKLEGNDLLLEQTESFLNKKVSLQIASMIKNKLAPDRHYFPLAYLLAYSARDLTKAGLGKKTLHDLQNALAPYDLAIGMTAPHRTEMGMDEDPPLSLANAHARITDTFKIFVSQETAPTPGGIAAKISSSPNEQTLTLVFGANVDPAIKEQALAELRALQEKYSETPLKLDGQDPPTHG